MDRVLHINDYPLDAGGGAEVMMARTIALLRERGLHVDIFTCADLSDSRRTAWRYIDNASARQALATTLAKLQPSVVHLHNFYHILSPSILTALADHKRTRPMRVVMTAHDYHLACPNSGGSWFRWLSGRREVIDPRPLGALRSLSRSWDQRGVTYSTLKLAQHCWNYRWHQRHRVIDTVICPSRIVEAMLTPLGLTTRVLPHPAPTLAARHVERASRLQFVFAGRIEPEKGLRELLECWPTDCALTVIGDGADLPRCQALVAERRLEVTFVGRLPHDETLARIAAAHVLVQPSRVLETYGLTLIEALASGANILAANRGAAPETIAAAGVGYLYELDDRASLIAALHAIRQDFDAGTLNRFDVADFLAERSEERYADALLEIYGVSAQMLRKAC
jgi:glycosyltransferase involved in cell wall biosynthesis